MRTRWVLLLRARDLRLRRVAECSHEPADCEVSSGSAVENVGVNRLVARCASGWRCRMLARDLGCTVTPDRQPSSYHTGSKSGFSSYWLLRVSFGSRGLANKNWTSKAVCVGCTHVRDHRFSTSSMIWIFSEHLDGSRSCCRCGSSRLAVRGIEHVSRVGSVLHRSCPASHHGRSGCR